MKGRLDFARKHLKQVAQLKKNRLLKPSLPSIGTMEREKY